MMELSINRTVDYCGLQAGVGGAKRYSGCHRSRVICDEVLTAAECVNIIRHPSAAMAEGPLIRLKRASKALALGLGVRFPPAFCHQQYKMTDPLSITASVMGIVVPALHGTRLLLEDLQQLKDAPKAVKRLVEDVHSVDTALELLKSIEEREWGLLGADVAKQSKTTIRSSTQACNLFRADLQEWTRHSEDGKLAWLDRANVGFFKKDQVKAMSEQLQSCKLAINLIVGVATL